MPSPREDEEARRLELAASQGDAEAQTELGLMRYFGDGVPQDFAEARRLYALAAHILRPRAAFPPPTERAALVEGWKKKQSTTRNVGQ